MKIFKDASFTTSNFVDFCDRCHEPIQDPGPAILFSQPMQHRMTTRHLLCKTCYIIIIEHINEDVE